MERHELNAITSAINSAVQINRCSPDASKEEQVQATIAINAIHCAVIGIASRLSNDSPDFDRDAFVKACGTVGANEGTGHKRRCFHWQSGTLFHAQIEGDSEFFTSTDLPDALEQAGYSQRSHVLTEGQPELV